MTSDVGRLIGTEPHRSIGRLLRTSDAAQYTDGLAHLPLELPVVAPGNSHVWHVYAPLTDRRDELQAHLATHGIPTLIYYPLPLHLQKCYADQGWRAGDYPVAEAVSRRILPLPMYPELTDEQIAHVIASVRSFFTAE